MVSPKHVEVGGYPHIGRILGIHTTTGSFQLHHLHLDQKYARFQGIPRLPRPQAHPHRRQTVVSGAGARDQAFGRRRGRC